MSRNPRKIFIVYLKFPICVTFCRAKTSQLILYSRVSIRRDSPLINYSLFSTPRFLILEILPASHFIPDTPFINSCAQSTGVAWSLGKATKLFDVHVSFYKHDVYRNIQAQVWWFFKHMLSIMLSLAKYCYVKHFSG